MPAEDDYKHVSDFADRLGLDGEDRDGFIGSSMKRLGYKPRTAWDDPDPQENNSDDGGDFFSRKKKKEEANKGGQQQQQQQRASGGGGGWQYE